MSRSRRTATLVVVLAWLACTAAWLHAASTRPFHPANAGCESCHLAGRATTAEQAHLLVASQERLCGNCHEGASRVSHPSGFTPSHALHKDYPLDWKGDMTCSTCHQVHGDAPRLMRGSRGGREFCVACHDAQFFVKMRDRGTSVMASGHLDAGSTAPGAVLDNYSRQCMECHGTKGEARATSVDRNRVVRHGGSAINHPIGANYAEAVRFGGYRAVVQLSKKILLPGGLLSCVSCHDGYTRTHGRLNTPTARSALCFECHNL